MNRALVSYHFGGKAGLYDAILDEAVRHAAARLDADDLESSVVPPERRLVELFAEVFSSRPWLAPMIMREHLDPNHLLDPQAASRLRGFMALTEKALALVPLREAAKRFDPQIVHLICVGPLVHFLIARRQREATADRIDRPVSKPSLDEFVKTLGDVLAHGLRRPN